MAEGDALPPRDTAARYCKPSQVDDGEVVGPAFELEGNHAELSMTWLEYLRGPPQLEQLREAKRVMSASLKLKPTGWLAAIRVEAITSLTHAADTELNLQVLHSPDANPAHCAVYGMPPKGSDAARAVWLALAGRIEAPAARIDSLD